MTITQDNVRPYLIYGRVPFAYLELKSSESFGLDCSGRTASPHTPPASDDTEGG